MSSFLRITAVLLGLACLWQTWQVLAPLVALQECLGALQDSVVARQRVQAMGLDEHAGVQAYLEARDAEGAARLEDLQRLWEKVGSATYRRRLFELIVKL